eukprot:7666179-Alexandrium_andersonii.AAC.1
MQQRQRGRSSSGHLLLAAASAPRFGFVATCWGAACMRGRLVEVRGSDHPRSQLCAAPCAAYGA